LSSETCAGYRLVSQGKTMDNLSTANSTDISNMIGALELDDHHLTSCSDRALEASVQTPTRPTPFCHTFTPSCGR
jgi:hypothetical protein